MTTMLVCFSSAACVGTDSETVETVDEALGTAASVEDVRQYDSCRENGHGSSGSILDLERIRDNDPAINASFATASCIIGRLGKLNGQFLPYHLQSFKPRGPGQQAFIFKRHRRNVVNEGPSECLKIKLTSLVGATDVYVTIERVKQLPSAPGNNLCSDNGET